MSSLPVLSNGLIWMELYINIHLFVSRIVIMLIRRFYILASLTLLPTMAYAQGMIRYSYDSAGNRIKREAVQPVKKTMTGHNSHTTVGPLSSSVPSVFSITVHPNPTEGLLRISIPGLKYTDKCTLEIYAAQGEQIFKENVTSNVVRIDISNHPPGIYLLKITVNNNSTTWKVIKK